MRVLITGANGLLGQKLIHLLSDDPDIKVIATGRGPQRIPASGFFYVSADLTDPESVQSLLRETKPDRIIHCAAMTQVDDCEQSPEACESANVTATEHLLKATEAFSSHFTFVSTDFVFDGENGPYKESDQPNPVSVYGASKLKAEQLVQASSLKTAIVRTVLVYGLAHDLSRSNLVLWVKNSLEAGKAIRVVNDQWRTPTLAEDLALGCWLVAEKKAEGLFHISGEGLQTPYEMALKVADAFDLDASLISAVDASTFTQPGKRPPKTGFLIDKAKQQLGFQPTPFEEGLQIVSLQLAQNQRK
ncbi:SDR family oxidoreductase [Marinoscillum furvescens]|uniref:dTDP-4-dehydrorhamnose reductase n=1 Tax=Marinoscillum furvescens DSM 4134 TaxID=1122208 RepID=A0A3D9L2I6_MARFU|nr:NAD(P)-dependent oxidoreductase [Marinoscillum furvescens]RED98928.1 dTDP-4-dehydrorhamnose reductase [Marinoscillum furvescens DSM 4134]